MEDASRFQYSWRIISNFLLVVIFSGSVTPYLYFSTWLGMRKIDLRYGFDYSAVAGHLMGTTVLDYDFRNDKLYMYYRGIITNKIRRCTLNGSACEDVITTGIPFIRGENQYVDHVWSGEERFPFPRVVIFPETKSRETFVLEAAWMLMLLGCQDLKSMRAVSILELAANWRSSRMSLDTQPPHSSQLLNEQSFISVCDVF